MTVDFYIPASRDRKYVERTINGVLNQRSEDWTLTIVDGSDPEKRAELKALVEDVKRGNPEKAGRISYCSADGTPSLVNSYNTIFEMVSDKRKKNPASGDLVNILGDDDRPLPNFVDVVTKAHKENPDVSLIQPSVITVNEDGNKVNSIGDRVKKSGSHSS